MTPLHEFGQTLREVLQSIPLSAVRALFVGSLALVLVWMLRLPRHAVTPASESTHRGGNLKPVATTALVIQILIYLLL